MIGKITFTIKKPKNVSKADFIEWIRFNCGEVREMRSDNVMIGVEMEDLIDEKRIKYHIKQ